MQWNFCSCCCCRCICYTYVSILHVSSNASRQCCRRFFNSFFRVVTRFVFIFVALVVVFLISHFIQSIAYTHIVCQANARPMCVLCVRKRDSDWELMNYVGLFISFVDRTICASKRNTHCAIDANITLFIIAGAICDSLGLFCICRNLLSVIVICRYLTHEHTCTHKHPSFSPPANIYRCLPIFFIIKWTISKSVVFGFIFHSSLVMVDSFSGNLCIRIIYRLFQFISSQYFIPNGNYWRFSIDEWTRMNENTKKENEKQNNNNINNINKKYEK